MQNKRILDMEVFIETLSTSIVVKMIELCTQLEATNEYSLLLEDLLEFLKSKKIQKVENDNKSKTT